MLRTNCIDCLDRTNVAQFSAGVCALGQQLLVMGVTGTLELEQGQAVVTTLMDMYSEIGDQLAMQYGGSEAHKKVASQGNSFTSVQGPTMGKHKEVRVSESVEQHHLPVLPLSFFCLARFAPPAVPHLNP